MTSKNVKIDLVYVGLSGHIGSGKSTIAKMLSDCLAERHLGTRIMSFAENVRRAAIAIDPLVNGERGEVVRLSTLVKSIGWDRAKREWPEVRRMLTVIGTEAGRDIHGDDCWIRCVVRDAADWARLSGVLRQVIIFDDLRFPNELDFVRGRGLAAWVENSMDETKADRASRSGDTHRSESHHGHLQQMCDELILNDMEDMASTWDRVRAFANKVVQLCKEQT